MSVSREYFSSCSLVVLALLEATNGQNADSAHLEQAAHDTLWLALKLLLPANAQVPQGDLWGEVPGMGTSFSMCSHFLERQEPTFNADCRYN